MGSIEELQSKLNDLEGHPKITTQEMCDLLSIGMGGIAEVLNMFDSHINDLAARLDKLTERVGELELASPCPLLKSICEDWEYDAKPSPDKQEMVERYTELVYPTCLTGRKRIRQILSDFFDEVRGMRKEGECEIHPHREEDPV